MPVVGSLVGGEVGEQAGNSSIIKWKKRQILRSVYPGDKTCRSPAELLASVVDQGGSERALDTGTSSATTLPTILRARTGRTTQPPPTDGALNYSSRPAPWTGDSAGRHYSPPPRMSPASAQVPIRAGRSSWPSPASEITA